MSKDWLAQLSAQAAQRGKARYLVPTPPRPQQNAAPAIDRQASGRSFISAIIGSIIRWAILAAIAGALAVFIITGQEEVQDPLGEKVLYTIWYLAAVTLPALVSDAASAIDANGIYNALKSHTALLPFAVPLLFGGIVTLLLLPTVNARRRQSGLRHFILLGNLALIWFGLRANAEALDLTGAQGLIDTGRLNLMPLFGWLVLLLISFVGGRGGMKLPQRPPAKSRPAPAMAAMHGTRSPGHAAAPAARTVSAAQAVARRNASPIERSGSSATWRRPR
jgi:hypothetical protein